MGNLKQTHDSRNRKHSAVGKPNRGSAVFRTFIACVTAFTLMMPITATAAIANDESDYDPDATEVSVAETVDNGAIAGEGETGDEPSSVGADGEDAPDGEAVSGDADKTGEEKAGGTDTAKDGKDAADKDAEDKDAKAEDDQGDKDSKDDADGKDSDGQDADDETADKAPETVESKGTVIDEAEDADDEAADKKDADEKDADKDDEAENMPAQAFEASLTTENGESLTVHVKAPKGAFPLDTTMKVTSVQSEDVPEAVEKAVSARTDDAVVDMQAVDISFKDVDGKEIEPAKKVTVTFTSDLISKDDEPMLVHVDDEGEANVLDPLSDKELKNRGVEANENELLVDSDEFSMYVLTLTGQLTADVLTADGKTYKITVTCDEDAQIPEDAELVVTEILSGTDEYQNYLDQAAEALGQENSEDVPYARFFDIEIHNAAGEKIEPAAPVQVKIELADAPEAEQSPLQVVHFEGDEETPVVVETKADEEADVCFEAESFSTWAVITTQLPSSVNDLDGWSFTLSRQGRYVTSNVRYYHDGTTNYDSPFRLRKSANSADAAIWTFEKVNEENGVVYYGISTMVNGQKRYLHMNQVYGNETAAHTTLETPGTDDCPQGFAVRANDDGTYTISKWINVNGRWFCYNLNEWGSYWGNGFAGYYQQNNDDHLTVTFQSAQPIVNVADTGEYAVIVKDTENNKYYSVQEDGRLVAVDYDESTGVVRVKLGVEPEEPFAWTYTSAHDSIDANGVYHEYGEDGHDQWEGNEPYHLRCVSGARGFDPQTRLKEGSYYSYITTYTSDAMAHEDDANPDHDTHRWDYSLMHENNTLHGVRWDQGQNRWVNNDVYVGADFDSGKLVGGANRANAATIFFARIEQVPPNSYSNTILDNETVSHIDIAIEGKAKLSFPLAYGTYYDENKEPILTVIPGHDVTLELEEKVPIDKEDIMEGSVTASREDGTPLDDAFYITGYSANNLTDISLVQVRMEGSFKVDTLGEYPGVGRSNDDPSWTSQRKANQVYYTVTTQEKDVTFDLEYNGKQLYDSQGNKMTYESKVAFAAKFSYWDDRNECPPLQASWETNPLYEGLINYARYHNNCNIVDGGNNTNWNNGAIINNDWASSPQTCYIGDSGMDFILAVEEDVPNTLLAYEITKYIVDADGNPIKPAEDVSNSFTVYHKAGDYSSSVENGYAVDTPVKGDDADLVSKQAGYDEYDNMTLTIPGGAESEGVASGYNYHPASGMFYVAEKPGQNQTITDVNGNVWKYKETRVETEYVWRGDAWSPDDTDDTDDTDEAGAKRHVVEGLSGVPEVLGAYEASDKELFNRFLEFYVYNVYEPAYGDIEITKAVGGASPAETSCVVHLEGTTPAGEKYESYAEIAYGDGKTGSVIVKHIPAGTKLTITEEYSGAGYDGDAKALTATIVGGKTVTPDDGGMFINPPNGDVVQGHGIQNNFELMENRDWEFTASRPVQSKSEDQE